VEIIEGTELDLDLLGTSRQGDDKKLNELILKGGNVMVMERHRETPLHFGSAAGHEAIVRLLLNTGQVDVNVRNTFGQKALELASRAGNEALIKLLSNIS